MNLGSVSSVASAASAASQGQMGDAVNILVLKKAIEMQAQSALQLLEALPAPAASNPAHLGQNVDVTA